MKTLCIVGILFIITSFNGFSQVKSDVKTNGKKNKLAVKQAEKAELKINTKGNDNEIVIEQNMKLSKDTIKVPDSSANKNSQQKTVENTSYWDWVNNTNAIFSIVAAIIAIITFRYFIRDRRKMRKK